MIYQFGKSVEPNPQGFDFDPFGYSILAWHKWSLAQTMAGFPVDISKPPAATDLKSPILWMLHARALCEAALNILRSQPNLDDLTIYTKGVCHCQYHAVALMLIGLSLEVALKAMLIKHKGIELFIKEENSHHHHRLRDLSNFIPELTEKDKAILDCLTHFIYWAGKYPDPGFRRKQDITSIFEISEKYEISAKHLFESVSRVMDYATKVVDENK